MKREPLRVALIGYGLIGQEVVRLITEHAAQEIQVVGALVRHATQARPTTSPTLVTSLSALLETRPHIVAEMAGHEGVREHAAIVLRAGIDLILVSIGALAEPEILADMLEAAQQGNARLLIASGAIGGLDALAAASLAGLTSVTHTLRKPPQTLLTPEEASTVIEAREIFRGTARQAAQRFPEFLNVAAAVALAGIGFNRTEVRVFADPLIKHSLHEFRAEGVFGTMHFEIENVPIQSDRGARLSAMSIVHILQMRSASLVIG